MRSNEPQAMESGPPLWASVAVRLAAGLSTGLHVAVLGGGVAFPPTWLLPGAALAMAGVLPSMLRLLKPLMDGRGDPFASFQRAIQLQLAPWKLTPVWAVLAHVAGLYAALTFFLVMQPFLNEMTQGLRRGAPVHPPEIPFEGPLVLRAFSAVAMAFCLSALMVDRMIAKQASRSRGGVA